MSLKVLSPVEAKLELLEKELQCVICLSMFDNPHSLPCNHQFCYDCIEQFFRVKSQCPLCKLPVFKRSIIKNQTLASIVGAYQNLKLAMGKTFSSPIKPNLHTSPRKRVIPLNFDDALSRKRTKKDKSPVESPARAAVPPGCMDFELELDIEERDYQPTRNTPPRRPVTREMSTQTILPFDPYIRTNSNPYMFTGKKKSGDNADGSETPDEMPRFNLQLSPSTPSASTASSSTTTPTSPPPNSTKVDLKNITGWNSLKKASPSTPTTPSSSRPTANGKSPHSSPSVSFIPPSSKPNATLNRPIPRPAMPQSPITTSTSSTPTSNHASPKPTLNHINGNHNPRPNHNPPDLISPTPFFPPPPVQNGHKKAANGTSHDTTTQNKPTTNGHIIQGPKQKIVKSKCKNIVILPTSVDKEMVAKLKGIMKELGGSVVTKYTSEVSHIVSGLTGANSARRTMKYCMGVVEGKWVVSFDWCTQSEAAKCWLDEERFEVDGDSVTLGGPKAAREAISGELDPLFTNCHIYLMGDFTTPTKPEVKKLLQLGGAEVFGKTPTKSKKAAPSITEAIVCSATAFSTLPEEEVAKLKGLGRTVVEARWVLDCVSYYQILPFTEYELSG